MWTLLDLFRRRGDATTSFRQVRDAIDTGDPALVRRVFMQFPAELNNPEPSTGSHLGWASRWADLQVVKAMVEFGADINLKDSRDGIAPIASACSGGHVEIAKYLLELGCELDVSASIRNPLFACIVGYGGARDEPRERFAVIADNLIASGMDLTACYDQQSMVDMDASAFAYMWGRRDIAASVITKLYGYDERLVASAWAEAIEVAVGNAFSRQKFRRWRYPPTRGKNAGATPPEGEYWIPAFL